MRLKRLVRLFFSTKNNTQRFARSNDFLSVLWLFNIGCTLYKPYLAFFSIELAFRYRRKTFFTFVHHCLYLSCDIAWVEKNKRLAIAKKGHGAMSPPHSVMFLYKLVPFALGYQFGFKEDHANLRWMSKFTILKPTCFPALRVSATRNNYRKNGQKNATKIYLYLKGALPVKCCVW